MSDFQLKEIQAEILEASDSLFTAMASNCPHLDKDRFYLALQNFILSQAKDEDISSTAANIEDMIAPYSFSGEMLVMAWNKWQQADKKEALKLAANFFEHKDSGALVRGINHMNALASIDMGDEGIDPELFDDYDYEDDNDNYDDLNSEAPESSSESEGNSENSSEDGDAESESSSDSEAQAALVELTEEEEKARDSALAEFITEFETQAKEEKETIFKSNKAALLGK